MNFCAVAESKIVCDSVCDIECVFTSYSKAQDFTAQASGTVGDFTFDGTPDDFHVNATYMCPLGHGLNKVTDTEPEEEPEE